MSFNKKNIEEILKFYKGIYKELESVHIKILPEIKNTNCIGRCNLETYGDFMFVGKMRYKKTKANYIELTQSDKNITFTLLHEISHAITPYYERKVKNEWIILDHSDKFYKNFLEITKIAYENKIIDKEYTLEMLKREDVK